MNNEGCKKNLKFWLIYFIVQNFCFGERCSSLASLLVHMSSMHKWPIEFYSKSLNFSHFDFSPEALRHSQQNILWFSIPTCWWPESYIPPASLSKTFIGFSLSVCLSSDCGHDFVHACYKKWVQGFFWKFVLSFTYYLEICIRNFHIDWIPVIFFMNFQT